jgi:hypothetical protein
VFADVVGNSAGPFTFTANGGTPPYTFAISAGTPPPGLALSSAGVVSGVFTTAGTFTFTVRATDSVGASGTSSLTATIAPPITISPSVLPTITVGVPFSQRLTATGGTGTGYTWTPTTGTQIPGLSINGTTGVLSGTPTTAGPYNRGFQVTVSGGNQGNIVYTGTVLPAAVPTMPQWMLIAFAVLLVGIAVRRLSMRRMARP